jgi:hypothetical protein
LVNIAGFFLEAKCTHRARGTKGKPGKVREGLPAQWLPGDVPVEVSSMAEYWLKEKTEVAREVVSTLQLVMQKHHGRIPVASICSGTGLDYLLFKELNEFAHEKIGQDAPQASLRNYYLTNLVPSWGYLGTLFWRSLFGAILGYLRPSWDQELSRHLPAGLVHAWGPPSWLLLRPILMPKTFHTFHVFRGTFSAHFLEQFLKK